MHKLQDFLDYLTKLLIDLRNSFVKFRTTKHRLPIETGRWRNIDRSLRFCTLCNNKRPTGHMAHLRKQFKSINTYDYIITLIKRRKKTIINIGSLFEET